MNREQEKAMFARRKKIFGSLNPKPFTDEKRDSDGHVRLDYKKLVNTDSRSKPFFKVPMNDTQKGFAIHAIPMNDYSFKTEWNSGLRTKKYYVEMKTKHQFSYGDDQPYVTVNIRVHKRARNPKTESEFIDFNNIDRFVKKLRSVEKYDSISQVARLSVHDRVTIGHKFVYGTIAKDIADNLEKIKNEDDRLSQSYIIHS